MSDFDIFAAVWFAGFNIVCFLILGFDKWRASRSGFRVSEFSIVLLAMLGGWAGGWLGMKIFQHKTSKWTFQLKYTLAVIPFAAEIWAWLHWR